MRPVIWTERGRAIWHGRDPHLLVPAPVPRSSAIRRSGSTSPLGFARASPSPPSHAEHGAALARKLSLGGGRPYTPSPQGEPEFPWWKLLKGGGGGGDLLSVRA